MSASDSEPVASPTLAPEEQIPLPKFMVRQPDGIYLTLQALNSRIDLLGFIDSIHVSAMRFADLNYACLQKFLYDCDAGEIAKLTHEFEIAGKAPIVKLARAIVPFPLDRQKCYANPKLIERGDAAEYVFEPVFVERADAQEVDADAYVDDGRDPKVERITLDVDEFVAAMWCKGVRFGIDVDQAKRALAADTSERTVVARMRQPTEGRNASVVELLTSMRRDNAPKLLADGRVDLHQYENRFPQVDKDTRLVKKVPRVPGKPGWGIAGNEIEPELPSDFDLATLSGSGTRIDRNAEGEFVVASLGGFLRIDGASKSLSISEKIINTEGVSVRTTGNLILTADEYEEHGVVQEKAHIEGKHMMFMADVFGDIVSQGGRVLMKKNLVDGSIKSPGGSITVEGNASRATLEAVGGEINVQYAENCRIIGAKVNIDKAVFCEVVAQELIVGSSEGSALAADRVQVGTTGARRDVETTISVLVPDMSMFAMQIEELNRRQVEAGVALRTKREELEAITGQADIKTYLLLSGKLASKELVMTAEQSANFQKLIGNVTPSLKRLKALNDELRASSGANDALVKRIQDAKREAERLSADVRCQVAEIAGDTVVRTLTRPPPQAGLELLQPRELRARLRESGTDSAVLFNGSSGEFAWRMVESNEPDDAQ